MKYLVWILLILLSLSICAAIKPAPASFYGEVFAQNREVLQGASIELYDGNDTLCGSFSVHQDGKYGLLVCQGDDPTTIEDEGAEHGDNLTFIINGFEAEVIGNGEWQSGALREVDLSIGEVTAKQLASESPEHVPNVGLKIFTALVGFALIVVFLWIYNKR